MVKKLYDDFISAVRNPERGLKERLFLCLTLATELAMIIAFIGDVLSYENKVEIMVLAASIVIVPVIILTCMYKNSLKTAAMIIVFGMVFVILPTLYFYGGGSRGGGVLWIIFAFMYAGLVLSGRLRTFIFIILTFTTVACYYTEFIHPEIISVHSRKMFFIDSAISIILIGTIGFVMTWLQGRLFEEESEKAKKEAERAEELTRSQNRFFSSMSHEIRTPINSILGLNELILRDTEATEEIVNEATGIQGAGKMLLALINDILDFSKMEAGSMDIVPVDYNVGDMLSEIVNMTWLKASEKGLKMDVSIDPDVPSVLYGDEVRIKQVIVNLVNNALKYTSEGSVGLRIDNDEMVEGFVILRISVTDTGMGIKREALPYLFDAFKRADQEKNRYIEGTGLGLSIVKQIVELMGGTVSVNSVYGEGSTFTVTVRQGVSDPSSVGELNIHNHHTAAVSAYEASFTAPEAAILIVDDNEMNLEVESRLLAETGMVIDKAKSGKEALDMAMAHRYDVILMDHLMPEMDGIECLEKLRAQAEGLNRTTPVVVLTANAGSENRELYNRSGFDGYVVKPVSGAVLEETLIRFISSEKVIMNNSMIGMHEDINAAAAYTGKARVMITSTSMCDLPDNITNKLNIAILPFLVKTDESVFKDGVQIEASEMIRYVREGGNAQSDVPDEEAYSDFFAGCLKRAHHLIHIALTTSMSKDYYRASEAAKSFGNVTVINSECLSSATGLLVLIAHKLVQLALPVDEMVSELNEVKKRLKCSFVIDNTDFMIKRGFIGSKIHAVAGALNLHPCLSFSEDRYGIAGIWSGSTKRAYKKYIRRALPVDVIPDSEVVFVTYADVPGETLQWIKEEISKRAYFERVVFKQASAAISSNCGPGTFGILYFVKSNKSYNIGSYFNDMSGDEPDADEADDNESPDQAAEEYEESKTPADNDIPQDAAAYTAEGRKESEWYLQSDYIDADAAIKNSGSMETLKTVLKIFHEAVPEKTLEIEGYYSKEDWHNYTIKIHALKSSARLIGAGEIADDAQLLENAGKDGDIDYILKNHEALMQKYHELDKSIAPFFDGEADGEADSDERPVADEFLLESVYEGLAAAAEAMSCDEVDAILDEMSAYRIPESECAKYDKIRIAAEKYDYDGMLGLLRS